LLRRSGTPVVSVGTNNAEKEFEELLSAVWAAQLAQLRACPDSGELQAEADSQVKSGDGVKAQEAE
jgi:hypothetical protein